MKINYSILLASAAVKGLYGQSSIHATVGEWNSITVEGNSNIVLEGMNPGYGSYTLYNTETFPISMGQASLIDQQGNCTFALVEDTCSNSNLAGQSACSITVQITPQDAAVSCTTNLYEPYAYRDQYIDYPISAWTMTVLPSSRPTEAPSWTVMPTVSPTWELMPTFEPSLSPTERLAPTTAPSSIATEAPTVEPSLEPTEAPTVEPSLEPTQAPTVKPSVAPTQAPTVEPSLAPTQAPTVEPSLAPSQAPTLKPSAAPTINTRVPTAGPTTAPSAIVSAAPSVEPSTLSPTQAQSVAPTRGDTSQPTGQPTGQPTWKPSQLGDINSNDDVVIRHDPQSDFPWWAIMLLVVGGAGMSALAYRYYQQTSQPNKEDAPNNPGCGPLCCVAVTAALASLGAVFVANQTQSQRRPSFNRDGSASVHFPEIYDEEGGDRIREALLPNVEGVVGTDRRNSRQSFSDDASVRTSFSDLDVGRVQNTQSNWV